MTDIVDKMITLADAMDAVKAETERCAKIAEGFSTANTYDLATGKHEIAAAIREGTND